jgi:hypothetical protein
MMSHINEKRTDLKFKVFDYLLFEKVFFMEIS